MTEQTEPEGGFVMGATGRRGEPVSDTTPQPMHYHGPGWTLDFSLQDEHGEVIDPGAIYQLWAPQDGAIHDPFEYAEHQSSEWIPRRHWSASWQSASGDEGDYASGDSAESVLASFEPGVRAKFEDVVTTRRVA